MESSCNICKLNRCKIKGRCYSFKSKAAENGCLGQALWQQQQSEKLCDVIITSHQKPLAAHRCVLAVESGYFCGLFAGNFSDGSLKSYEVPTTPVFCMEKVLYYLYNGCITLENDELESVYILSDFLCIDQLREFCKSSMIESLNCKNCFSIFETSVRYGLSDVQQEVVNFMCPNVQELVCDFSNSCKLSIPALESFLMEEKLNYLHEDILLEYILKWAMSNRELEKLTNLLTVIDPDYLSKSKVKEFSNTPFYKDLTTDHVKENYEKRKDFHENCVILCRSRGFSNKEYVYLLSYSIETDDWQKIPLDIDSTGLESMVQHKDNLYFLTSTSEDICGYFHTAQEVKSFYSLNLSTKQICQHPSPTQVTRQCRLISHINGLFILDKYGRFEMFDVVENQWFEVGSQIFKTVPSATMYVIPMPMDRYIYILRSYNLGYSTEYAEFALELHIFDTISGSSRLISSMESSELDLDPLERYFGYIVEPGKISLKDCLGQNRLEFNLSNETWVCVENEKVFPKCFGTPWGMVQNKGKCYIICNSPNGKQYFFLYDWIKKRIKALSLPKCHITGLMLAMPNGFIT